jgi:hypothetical protein
VGGSWSSFSPPSSAGSFAPETMLLLTDGSVLMHSAAGGSSNYSGSNQWIRLTPDSKGNYPTGTWSALLTMSNTRQFFSSAVLPDGRVYVMGGEYTDANGAGRDGSLGEIFDPHTNLWSPMSKPDSFGWIQGDASGAVLADGRVLLGNLQTTSPPFTTALWDPVTDDWTVAGSAFGTLITDTKNSNCNEETWTLLPDGSVLTVDASPCRSSRRTPTVTGRLASCFDAEQTIYPERRRLAAYPAMARTTCKDAPVAGPHRGECYSADSCSLRLMRWSW